MQKANIARLELSHDHALWLETKRNIPSELAAEMGIVSQGKNVVFEYRRNGELLWRQVRMATSEGKTFACYAPDGRTLKEAGIELSFWNEDDLLDTSVPEAPRVITEGQFDTASFRAAGATYVGSVPNGAVDRMGEGEIIASEDRQFAYLWELDPSSKGRYRLRGGLATAKKIILATDDDKAGHVLREELSIRLGRTRCWYLTYPQQVIADLGRPCKDANEVHVHLGLDAVVDMLADARPMVPDRLVRFSDISIRKREPVSSGWPDLNSNLMIVRPELMILTGPPNHGKTQLAQAIGANLAYCHGWPGSVIQFEDDIERAREGFARYWLGREGRAAPPGPLTAEQYQEAAPWLDRMLRTIVPSEELDDEVYDLAWLRRNIDEAATRHGHRWVIIDPWNEIEHVFPKGQTEAQYLNDALRSIKRLGRRYQMLIMLVAHPDKEGGREPKIENWSLYNMAGGAVWNNKADHGIIVHRPDPDEATCHVKIAKSKWHNVMGRPGIVRMRFRPTLGTYEYVGAGA